MAGPPVSPWVWEAGDSNGNVIRATVTFDNVTGALSGMTVFRDPACLYVHVYIGTGPDGTPNTAARQWAVPAGSTNVTAGQLAANGLHTISEMQALQITAGP
jgi:hypothetical protein